VSAATLLQGIAGLPVSQVWRGYGPAIFVDFGALSRVPARQPRSASHHGEATLMIEWSWRIERPRSILCGSWSDERKWKKALDQLVGHTVISVQCFGRLPEISVGLSNGLYVVSAMTAEGQPSWALILRGSQGKSVHVSGGRLVVEHCGAA
jgi:hypothetical protein